MGEQTLRAVTLKQLANVNIPQDNVFRIDNVDLTQVRHACKGEQHQVSKHWVYIPVHLCRCYSKHSRTLDKRCIYDGRWHRCCRSTEMDRPKWRKRRNTKAPWTHVWIVWLLSSVSTIYLHVYYNREDSYVRVFGRLNSFNGKVTVVAHKIRPVTNFNEISYHFLEAIMTHLAFTKKPVCYNKFYATCSCSMMLTNLM